MAEADPKPPDGMEGAANDKGTDLLTGGGPAIRPPLAEAAALIALVLVPVTLLTFLRVSDTEVEAELKLERISFTLVEASPLGPVFKISQMDLDGLAVLDPVGVVDASTDPSRKPHRLTLSPWGSARHRLALDWGLIPAHSLFDIEARPGTSQFRIAYTGATIEPSVTASGHFKIKIDGLGHGSRKLDADAFDLASGSEGLSARLQLAGEKAYRFASLRVRDPVFTFESTIQDGQQRVRRTTSSVSSGSLRLIELGNREISVRPRDLLTLDEANGIARTIELSDKGEILFNFYGTVRGLRLETWGGTSKNLMPRCLEWFYARDWLVLAWAALTYFSGLILGVFLWWWRITHGKI